MAVPYTAATIRAQIRYLLNEPVANYWTDTEINNYVAIGCREVSRSSLCVEATYGIALQTGIMEYSAAAPAEAGGPGATEGDITYTAGPPGTITSAATATFITDGLLTGMTFTESGSASNAGNFTIRSIDSELIMTVFETVVAEGGGATITYLIDYDWIADVVKVYGCTYVTGTNSADDVATKGLQKIHPRNLRHLPNLTDGPPYYWWHFGDAIGIYPEPSASEDNHCVYVYHSKVTEAIADIPDEYQPAVLYWAMSRARMKERSMGEAQMWYSMYLNSMAYQRQTQYERGADSNQMRHIPDRTVAVG